MARITFGALVYDYQAMDVLGPTDLLNSSGRELLRACQCPLPLSFTDALALVVRSRSGPFRNREIEAVLIQR